MRLVDASAYFDRTVCTDAYGAATFKGQLGLFDDSTRDGTTVERRVLSVADGTPIPARRAILVHGDPYIIGADHPDSFNGAVIRRKYVCHRAEGLATVLTADQALRSLAGTQMYAARMWIKDMKEIETSSRVTSFVDIYVASVEAVAVGAFVLLSGRYHLVRNTMVSAAGFLTLESDQLETTCLGTAAYSSRAGNAYDPANDVVYGTNSVAPMLVHRWQSEFFYERLSAVKFDHGDVVARASSTALASPQTGDSFVFGGVNYNVLSVRDDGLGAWILHGRRD